MAFKIGFTGDKQDKGTNNIAKIAEKPRAAAPRKSVVQVRFDSRHLTCAYYNDLFDLRVGDMVYVEGKLEGLQGCVVEVSYTFKIKLSDYKRVTYLIDTKVRGDLFLADSYAIAFKNSVIPFKKVAPWFKAPDKEEEEIAFSAGDTVFDLYDLSSMEIDKAVVSRGYDYYVSNRVVYLEIDGHKGNAVVEGRDYYTVEFDYEAGVIKNMVCNCYCIGTCKHEFAVMLELKEMLKFMKENNKNSSDGYLAIISKNVLLKYALTEKTPARITIWG